MGLVNDTLDALNNSIKAKVLTMDENVAYMILDGFKDIIDLHIKDLKAKIEPKVKIGESLDYKDERLKIVLEEGATKKELNHSGIFQYLYDQDRVADIKSTCSFQKKELEKLSDSKVIIQSFEFEVGKNKPSLKVKALK